ncbi:MAG: glycoside hydrolase family 99-like domain-containing protein [Selenomonadaceae bacterium]|nr:glycoside hydrolase family 99-like domain-containing protein [Selenomonadaceae bacterium]
MFIIKIYKIFINSWNEWAEGSHVELYCRYG